MSKSFAAFLALPDQDRKDVFEAAADRLDTVPQNVEKDFWVCLVLDALYNRLPGDHPHLVFKGATSLSKAFGLIQRFSEDIDLVVDRAGLGFSLDRDPATQESLSNKVRNALFRELKVACSNYVSGALADALATVLGDICKIVLDKDDNDQQTLLFEYSTLYPSSDIGYVQPKVKLEAGARSALNPQTTASVAPYISKELNDDWLFDIANLHVIAPSRTFLEKLLILHGAYCGYRDAGRLPADRNRISRHYYDVAMITGTMIGAAALADETLLTDVREHKLIAFRQAWKKFDEAVPGSIHLVPEDKLHDVVTKDYKAMQGMMLGDAPKFDWVMSQLQDAQNIINRSVPGATRQSEPGNPP